MAEVLNKQLIEAIEQLNTKQKKTVLGIARALADEGKEHDHWKDEHFVSEMESRYNDYKSGKTQLVSLEDVEKKANDIAAKIKERKVTL
jgi:hypothetical protein